MGNYTPSLQKILFFIIDFVSDFFVKLRAWIGERRKFNDKWKYINTIKNISYEKNLIYFGLPSGVKWATCNVGANKPEEYGYYFAWGETRPKARRSDSKKINPA